MRRDDRLLPFHDPRHRVNATAQAQRGRVLVVAERNRARPVVEKLVHHGYASASAEGPADVLSLAQSLRPEAILLASPGDSTRAELDALRADHLFSQIPILADLTEAAVDQVRALGVDDWVHSDDELTHRLEAAVRARRLIERDAQSRLRMEMLLEIAEAATSSLELEQILGQTMGLLTAV